MMFLVLLLSAASCITQTQQQVVAELSPIILRSFQTRRCTDECIQLTNSCVASVQALCSKECENAPDPITCHRFCEEEGIYFSNFPSILHFSLLCNRTFILWIN